MFECDEILLQKAIQRYEEKYGKGQMYIDKLDKIVEELKQEQKQAKKKETK